MYKFPVHISSAVSSLLESSLQHHLKESLSSHRRVKTLTRNALPSVHSVNTCHEPVCVLCACMGGGGVGGG